MLAEIGPLEQPHHLGLPVLILTLDSQEELLAPLFDFLLRKLCVLHDVSQQIQRQIQVFLEDLDGDAIGAVSRRSLERTTHTLDGLSNGQFGTLLGSRSQQGSREFGQSGMLGILQQKSAQPIELDRHQRQGSVVFQERAKSILLHLNDTVGAVSGAAAGAATASGAWPDGWITATLARSITR